MSPSGRSATLRRPVGTARRKDAGSPRSGGRPDRGDRRDRRGRPDRRDRGVRSARGVREPSLVARVLGAGTGQPGREGRAVAMDPRIQERRADVLREQARHRLRRALVVLGLCGVAVAGWFVLHSSVFGARAVTVVGVPAGQRSAVIAAAGLDGAPPLLDVGPGNAAGVERLPWVASATVSAQWPDGARVVVSARTPVAVAPATPSGFAEVDRDGHVQAVVPTAPAGLVTVAGVAAAGGPGTVLHGARAALAVASTLPKAFSAQVTQVQEGPGGDVTLHLTSPVTVYLGSTADLHAKYEDVAALLAGAALANGDVIDVSAPSTPVVRP